MFWKIKKKDKNFKKFLRIYLRSPLINPRAQDLLLLEIKRTTLRHFFFKQIFKASRGSFVVSFAIITLSVWSLIIIPRQHYDRRFSAKKRATWNETLYVHGLFRIFSFYCGRVVCLKPAKNISLTFFRNDSSLSLKSAWICCSENFFFPLQPILVYLFFFLHKFLIV